MEHNMKVAIIGSGHVGLVTGACLAEKGHQVVCIDNNQAKIRMLKAGRMTIYEPDLLKLVKKNYRAKRLTFTTKISTGVKSAEVIFIAVGTPLGETGAADLTQLERVAREIAEHLPPSRKGKSHYKIIAEKSTVPVQTGENVKACIKRYASPKAQFDIVSNPEFLQEGTAIKTTLQPDRIVIGVESKRAARVMCKLYETFGAPIIVTDINSAELIKHASNAFLAMKISYVNALANICELAKADVHKVAQGIGTDKRIGLSFLKAGIGYGGYCLPKDVAAFAHIAERLGYPFNLLYEVQRINRDQRTRFVKKIEDELWVLKDKTITLLGLSFKPDTDDIRESPALEILRELLAKGARIRAYDPKSCAQVKKVLAHKMLTYCNNLYVAAKGSHCLVIATDWAEFKQLDLKRLKKVMTHPTIIDGRNIFEPERMKKAGFTYRCIGRPYEQIADRK